MLRAFPWNFVTLSAICSGKYFLCNCFDAFVSFFTYPSIHSFCSNIIFWLNGRISSPIDCRICSDGKNEELLHEVILIVGYFTVLNQDNQVQLETVVVCLVFVTCCCSVRIVVATSVLLIFMFNVHCCCYCCYCCCCKVFLLLWWWWYLPLLVSLI